MEEEIDLKNIFKAFWDRKIAIIIIVLVCIVIGFIYTTYFVNPVYTATTKVILTAGTGTEDGQSPVTQGEVTLNNSLLGTYRGIATSDSVVNTVIKNLGLNISAGTLRSQISVTSETNTQIIQISVENADASLSAKIANELSKVFIERVAEIYDMQNLQQLDEAPVPTSPSNINHAKDILIFFAGGIVLSVIFVVLANLLDNTVKSSSDIEKAIGVNVIAEIPVYEFNRGRKR